MRHAFKPCSGDCGRCAVCLRSLDCAPHLPVAPPTIWGGPDLATRTDILNRSRRLAASWSAEMDLARGAVQGGR